MARTEQSDLGIAGHTLGRPPQPSPRRRLSSGHVVMIVAGLLAALLTYSALRQAGGTGTEVVVAAVDIHAGQVADPSLFATTGVKAPASALAGILRAGDLPGVEGKVATTDVAKGQLVAEDRFQPATPAPPRMALAVDPASIPGGPAALTAGSRIDLIGSTQSGQPFVIPSLTVVDTPQAPSGRSLGAATTVSVDVAVPDTLTAEQVLLATTAGKFVIRVTSAGAPTAGR